MNVHGDFNLTKELENFKKQQWTAIYKYKLIKAINSKYPMVQNQLRNKTKQRFLTNNDIQTSLGGSPSRKANKVETGTITDPDILKMLDQIKQYYDNQTKSSLKSSNKLNHHTISHDDIKPIDGSMYTPHRDVNKSTTLEPLEASGDYSDYDKGKYNLLKLGLI